MMRLPNALKITMLAGAISTLAAHAAPSTAPATGPATSVSTEERDGVKVTRRTRYRAQQSLDFDKQVIQGGVQRPESSVVTGNRDQVSDGLLSLREDFLDHARANAGLESSGAR